MSVATVRNDTGFETDFEGHVVILSPGGDSGRQVKACVDEAGGFLATVLRYDRFTPAELNGPAPGIIMLVIPESAGASGPALCRQMRLATDLPLVICSTNGDERDIVRALETGADDYVVTPTQPRVLAARLRAVLRRSAGWASPEPARPLLVAGEFELRLNEQRVFRKGKSIDLSAIEFRLLASLMRRAGQLVTHSQLLAEVWGPQCIDSRNYLRLYVQYLREKVEDDPRRPKSIVNEWGVGYRFEPGGSGIRRRTPRVAA